MRHHISTKTIRLLPESTTYWCVCGRCIGAPTCTPHLLANGRSEPPVSRAGRRRDHRQSHSLLGATRDDPGWCLTLHAALPAWMRLGAGDASALSSYFPLIVFVVTSTTGDMRPTLPSPDPQGSISSICPSRPSRSPDFPGFLHASPLRMRMGGGTTSEFAPGEFVGFPGSCTHRGDLPTPGRGK
jgi:hypothetical protein